jgi:outer membrane protein assembly factor BamB
MVEDTADPDEQQPRPALRRSGTELWSYSAPEGMVVNSAPAIYSANGKEYIALTVNLGATTGKGGVGQSSVITFALP